MADPADAYNAAAAAFNAGRCEEAYTLWTSIVSAVRATGNEELLGSIHTNRGACCLRLQRWEAAIAAYDEAIEEGGVRSGQAYHRRAIACRSLGRHAEAAMWEEAAVGEDPDLWDARRGRTQSLIALEDWEGAEAAALEAVAAREDDAGAAVDLAFVLLKAGDRPGEAAAEFARARELGDASEQTAGLYAAALGLLGESLGEAGELEEAAGAYDAACAVVPTEGRAYNAGVLHLRAGERNGEGSLEEEHFAAALTAFDAALALNDRSVAAPAGRAQLLMSGGDTGGAAAAYAAAAALSPQDARLFFNWGVACMKLDRAENAVPKFERALALMPDFEAAAHALAVARAAVEAGRPPAPEDMPTAAPERAEPEVARPYSPSQWYRDPERVEEDFDGYGAAMYGLASLAGVAGAALPPDVDTTHKESFLSHAEFYGVFAMRKEEFYALPKWRRNELKRSRKLF